MFRYKLYPQARQLKGLQRSATSSWRRMLWREQLPAGGQVCSSGIRLLVVLQVVAETEGGNRFRRGARDLRTGQVSCLPVIGQMEV